MTKHKNGINEDSNFVIHARRELELIGEEPAVIDDICRIMTAFADMRHSGGSASVVIPWINRLLQFKNLSPITDNPEDWIEVGPQTWQNRRSSDLFSHNGGKSYHSVDWPHSEWENKAFSAPHGGVS